MIDFLKLVVSCLPLFIEKVEWDGDSLVLSGDDWSFVTNSAWRVSKDKELLFACWDSLEDVCAGGMEGLSVIDVSWVIKEQPIDPSFILSDGRRIDVFCSSFAEPWIMNLPDDNVYVGNS